jgi:transcription elongation factor GreA
VCIFNSNQSGLKPDFYKTKTTLSMAENKYCLTKEGLAKIRKDYEFLLKFRNTKTTGEVPSIWHSEDVNPEYLSFQEDMGVLEARLTEYEDILKNAELITLPPKDKRTTVCLGATVTLEEEPGKIVNEYTILGTFEANPGEGKISADSPVGRKLLGKRIEEEIVINSPIRVVYRVKKITYSF